MHQQQFADQCRKDSVDGGGLKKGNRHVPSQHAASHQDDCSGVMLVPWCDPVQGPPDPRTNS